MPAHLGHGAHGTALFCQQRWWKCATLCRMYLLLRSGANWFARQETNGCQAGTVDRVDAARCCCWWG
jgi:hypothetical protein